MIDPSRRSKGRPLFFLVTVVLIWVAARSIAWLTADEPFATDPSEQQLAGRPVEPKGSSSMEGL